MEQRDQPANVGSMELLGAWVPTAERMPASGVTVLACYRNSLGNWRLIRAQWVKAKNVEANPESEIGEYDEETDTYYDPEGWYEAIDNWDDYTHVAVYQGEVTHWMPLPPPPIVEVTGLRREE